MKLLFLLKIYWEKKRDPWLYKREIRRAKMYFDGYQDKLFEWSKWSRKWRKRSFLYLRAKYPDTKYNAFFEHVKNVRITLDSKRTYQCPKCSQKEYFGEELKNE